MLKGTVKFFNEDKGYGFITNESNEDVFVHQTGLEDDIKQGDHVSYELEQGKKGPLAVGVEVIYD